VNPSDESLEPLGEEPAEKAEPAPASRALPELFGPPKPPPTPLMVLEAAFLCLGHSLTMDQLKTLFANEYGAKQLKSFIAELRADWQARGMGVELVEVEGAWKLRIRPDFAESLGCINPDAAPRYSKAVIETLAVIAYKQPVTRRTIEDHRGVSVSPAVLEQLEDRGWIEVIGHQESPGKPALYATTFKFLDDLGLQTLADMPLLPGEGPLVLPEAPVPGFDYDVEAVSDVDAYEPYDGPIEGQSEPWSPDQYAPPLKAVEPTDHTLIRPPGSTFSPPMAPPVTDPLFAPLDPLTPLPELGGVLDLGPLPELPPLPDFLTGLPAPESGSAPTAGESSPGATSPEASKPPLPPDHDEEGPKDD
jgi:segregation and condensation protein B